MSSSCDRISSRAIGRAIEHEPAQLVQRTQVLGRMDRAVQRGDENDAAQTYYARCMRPRTATLKQELAEMASLRKELAEVRALVEWRLAQ